MSYSNGLQATYRFPAAAIDTAGVIGRIAGPDGKTGRVTSVSVLCTVQLTGGDSLINVGNSGDADAYGVYTVPATAANARAAGSYAEGVENRVAADSVIEVSSDGGATAGDGDVVVTVEWS